MSAVAADPADASTETFRPAKKTRKALVFKVRGVPASSVRKAKLKMRGKNRRVRRSVRAGKVRRKAGPGQRLKVRRPKAVRSGKLKLVLDDSGDAESSGDAGSKSSGPCETDLTDLTASGCATDLRDTASASDPDPAWGKVDCESDSRHRQLSGDADSHPDSSGAAQGDDSYRRLTVLDGDDVWGERCELGLNDHRSSPTALYREGERRLTFASFRLPDSFPLETNTWQVVMQMKQAQPSANGGGTPVLSLEAREGYWQLIQSDSSGPSSDTHELWSARAQKGVWTRFAFDAVYSQDPGKGSIRVYVDLNGDGDAADDGEQSPNFDTYTLKRETAGGSSSDGIAPGESIPSHLRAGPYHNSSIDCPGGCSVDVDNVQVTKPV